MRFRMGLRVIHSRSPQGHRKCHGRSRGDSAGMDVPQVRRRDAPLHLTCTFVVGLPGFEPGTS